MRFDGHKKPVSCVCATADGGFVVTGGRDKLLVVTRTATGRMTRMLRGQHNGGAVTCMCATPDGQGVVTGSQDRTGADAMLDMDSTVL